jgi:hypothetical protein
VIAEKVRSQEANLNLPKAKADKISGRPPPVMVFVLTAQKKSKIARYFFQEKKVSKSAVNQPINQSINRAVVRQRWTYLSMGSTDAARQKGQKIIRVIYARWRWGYVGQDCPRANKWRKSMRRGDGILITVPRPWASWRNSRENRRTNSCDLFPPEGPVGPSWLPVPWQEVGGRISW